MAASEACIGWGGTATGFGNMEINTMSGPNTSADRIDVTHYSSPDGYKEFINGLIDPGDFTCSGNYTGSAYSALRAMQVARSVNHFSVTFASGSGFEFDGIVRSVTVNAPATGKVDMNLTITITGAIGTI